MFNRREVVKAGAMFFPFRYRDYLARVTGEPEPDRAKESIDGGEQTWSLATGGEITSSPSLDGDNVYFGVNHLESHGRPDFSKAGAVYAADQSTGEVQWKVETGKGVMSSPALQGDRVFFGSADGNVYASEDGEIVWTHRVDGAVSSSPTVVNETVYVGAIVYEDVAPEDAASELESGGDGVSGSLLALEASTGDLKWSHDTEKGVISSPCVSDGVVYFTSELESAHAVDAEDGTGVWEVSEENVISSPVLHRGKVFFGQQRSWLDDDGKARLFCVDAETGEEKWVFDEAERSIRATPTAHGDRVYIGCEDGKVYSLDVESGREVWRSETEEPVRSSPTYADGVIYVGSYDSSLYAFDAGNGDVHWSFGSEDHIQSSPTVSDGTVYFGSYDGNLYAVDAGVEGSSEGARVKLGVLGQNHT